jgi:hypothetical protein
MRAIGSVLVTAGCAVWLAGAVYSAPSFAAPQQASSSDAVDSVRNHSREAEHVTPTERGTHTGIPSDEQPNHRKISTNKLPSSKPSVSKSNRPSEPSNRGERTVRDNSENSHRPASDKSAGAAQNGLARNETVNHAPSIRASSAARPAVPSLSNVRHRGPNPPIVGGVGNSNSTNTAALDGAHMNRKHTAN